MPKISTDEFRVRSGKKVDLDKWPTAIKPLYKSKEACSKLLTDQVEKLSELQNLLYASNQHSLLLIFQAMDAAGKDSAIKRVMSGINPQGCQVFSFQHPSAEELDHDFLWKATGRLPERGRIGIFNRSYYEEVLIVRVHPEILANQNIPGDLVNNKTIWRDRFASMVNLEHHLHRNGTRVVKFFLHLSKEEQRKRFLARIDNPAKNWKFGSTDIEERKFWKQYMHAYQECLQATSTKTAPWYVVPADDKSNTQLIIAEVILETMRALKMSYPEPTPERRAELQAIRTLLDPWSSPKPHPGPPPRSHPPAPAPRTEPYPIGNGVSAPVAIYKETPAYPPEVKDARIEGEVRLSTVIDENGIPTQISVVQSLEPALDAAAIESLEKWRFPPGTKDGQPVPVRATIAVNFKLL